MLVGALALLDSFSWVTRLDNSGFKDEPCTLRKAMEGTVEELPPPLILPDDETFSGLSTILAVMFLVTFHLFDGNNNSANVLGY